MSKWDANGRKASLIEVSLPAGQNNPMRNMIGFVLQFAALVALPVMVIYQLNVGFSLLWMPMLTVAWLVVFYVGHFLRDKVS